MEGRKRRKEERKEGRKNGRKEGKEVKEGRKEVKEKRKKRRKNGRKEQWKEGRGVRCLELEDFWCHAVKGPTKGTAPEGGGGEKDEES